MGSVDDAQLASLESLEQPGLFWLKVLLNPNR